MPTRKPALFFLVALLCVSLSGCVDDDRLLTQVHEYFSSAEQPRAATQQLEVEEQESNAILMKDGFEYRIIDYGVGRIQVRNQDAKTTTVPKTKPRFGPILPKPKELSDFTEQLFWVEFQITNKAEHLIGNPRYFP